LVSLVEVAYRPHTAHDWLAQVLTALRPLLDRGSGLLCYSFDAADSDRIQLGEPLFAGAGHEVWEAMQQSTRGLEPRAVQRTYLGTRPFGSVAQRFTGDSRRIFSELARQNYQPNGFSDLLVLHLVQADRRGCLFAAPLGRSVAASRKEITIWSRIAAHLRAGYRASLRYGHALEDADAVLDPNGRVLDARGLAASAASREALRQAALSAERARRARPDSRSADELELWPALVAGHWTLIERFDADGRRFLLARRNEPDVQKLVKLTPREREVIRRVLLGQANKLIAHDLLVSEATVSEHLKIALAKLNLRSLAELRDLGDT